MSATPHFSTRTFTRAVPRSVIAAAARERTHLIFDLDGTLVDSNAACVAILQDMLVERGSARRLDAEAARPWMSRGGVRMVAALLGDECRDPTEDLGEFRARYLRRTNRADELYDGVADGMECLAAAGFTLAICSNKPQRLCEKVLADTGLAPMVAATVGGRPELNPKPAPDALREVLRALRQTAGRCIFIGDSDIDYRVATDADLPFAFMTYGYAESGWRPDTARAWRHRAAQCFDRFEQLVDALRAGAGARR